jgi:type III secretion system chaperone SycN
MNWVNQTVADFGLQMGLADLDFGTHGVVQLMLQSGGLLAVEPVQHGDIEEVLIYVGQPLGFDAANKIIRALSCVHYSQNTRIPIQIASLDNTTDNLLIALVRLPIRDFTLQSLGHAFDYLNRWFEAL